MGGVSLGNGFTHQRAMGGGVVVLCSAEVVIQVKNDARNLGRSFYAIPRSVTIRKRGMKELKWS
jgi:hypothetical protein